MPNRPHKWGLKLFVLCDVTAFAYNLDVNAGQENIVPQNERESGLEKEINAKRKRTGYQNMRLRYKTLECKSRIRIKCDPCGVKPLLHK